MTVTFTSPASFAKFCAVLVKKGIAFNGEQKDTNLFYVHLTGY